MEHLREQLINELEHTLRPVFKMLNEAYEGFYHFKIFTIVDLDGQECSSCPEEGAQCLRCVISFQKTQAEDELQDM